jgi:hypothetical protein
LLGDSKARQDKNAGRAQPIKFETGEAKPNRLKKMRKMKLEARTLVSDAAMI